MEKRSLICDEMYKNLLRIVFSICLCFLVGHSFAYASLAIIAPNVQVIFTGEQVLQSKFQLAPDFVEANQIQTLSLYEIIGNRNAVAIEIQETEDETRHDNYPTSLKKVKNTYFKNFILLENSVLKVSFRAFTRSLSLFSESFRLHLLIQVFTI